jgi:hypothetical protein
MVLAGPTLHTCASPAATLVGLARTIYIQCTTGILGREIAKYTVKYGIYIWFWLGQPNTLAHHQLPPHLCITSCRHTCLPSKQATMYKKGLFVNTHYTCNTLHTRKQRPHHTPPPPANTPHNIHRDRHTQIHTLSRDSLTNSHTRKRITKAQPPSPVMRSSSAFIIASATFTMALRLSHTKRWDLLQEALRRVRVSLWYLHTHSEKHSSHARDAIDVCDKTRALRA